MYRGYISMIHRVKKGIKWFLIINLVAVAALLMLCIYTNVPTNVTREDAIVFKRLALNAGSGLSANFEEELAIIRKVQSEVFKKAPRGDIGIPDYQPREPADLMRFGQGLCFDRSRTFDKAFRYYGFESRHVYILYKYDLPFWKAVFKYGQPSHAVTEVKTKKGWMFVDSNTQWIALTRQGEPVNADDVWKRFAEFDNPPRYLAGPWWGIRGMYSRKGHLYGAGIPFPEFNWHDFLSWFVFDEILGSTG